MPYVKKEERPRYNKSIEEMTNLLLEKFPGENGRGYSEGDLNYVISSIVWKLWGKKKSYASGNTLMGVLECVKQEFYRRQLAELENKKILENGDL